MSTTHSNWPKFEYHVICSFGRIQFLKRPTFLVAIDWNAVSFKNSIYWLSYLMALKFIHLRAHYVHYNWQKCEYHVISIFGRINFQSDLPSKSPLTRTCGWIKWATNCHSVPLVKTPQIFVPIMGPYRNRPSITGQHGVKEAAPRFKLIPCWM